MQIANVRSAARTLAGKTRRAIINGDGSKRKSRNFSRRERVEGKSTVDDWPMGRCNGFDPKGRKGKRDLLPRFPFSVTSQESHLFNVDRRTVASLAG